MDKDMKNKFLLVTYIFILGLLLINYEWLGNIFGTITNVLSPFLTGAVIAFILNVIINIFIFVLWINKKEYNNKVI